MGSEQVTCPACHTEHEFRGMLSFRAECDRCAADLHVCLACRHYDPGAENSCREVQAEYVADKARRNLCEDFKPTRGHSGQHDEQAHARARLAALFGETPAASPPADAAASPPRDAAAEARARLDALFRKS